MNETKDLHTSVLLKESVAMLNVKPTGTTYVDCTLGRGGHAALILNKLTTGTLVGLDQDADAIKFVEQKFANFNNFKLVKGNFENLKLLLATINIFQVDGILYDLGVSSPQFDNAERGFSYRFDGPLDMRMDQSQSLTAHQVVNDFDEASLSDIL
jgi:16S rRNA (cytosine1402-N4)-methyltransferase